MIRAWTILSGKEKNPVAVGNGATEFQYPIFPTLKEAKTFRAAHVYMSKDRIVRCQIRIEGPRYRG